MPERKEQAEAPKRGEMGATNIWGEGLGILFLSQLEAVSSIICSLYRPNTWLFQVPGQAYLLRTPYPTPESNSDRDPDPDPLV